MPCNVKLYCIILLTIFMHAKICSSDTETMVSDDRKFFEAATSESLLPQKKHAELLRLIEKKANIAVTGSAATLGAFSGATALYNVVQVAGATQRDDTQSIKLLIEHKSPLKTAHPELSVLERAINHEMLSTIQMLVEARADLHEQPLPGGQTCLHQIANPLFSNDNNACMIFDILKKQGNLPIDSLTLYGTPGYTAIHLSNHKSKDKKKLTQLLLAHGANPYCPAENCTGCHRRYNKRTRTIHRKWKAQAQRAVLEKINIPGVRNIVIDYCFWNPRNNK